MAAVLEVVGPPKARPVNGWSDASRWPRSWSEQQVLLERQHDRLEAALTRLIEAHCDGRTELAPPEEQVEWSACAILLRQLSLHLRLEERWLSQWDALCGGHRASHRQVATAATLAFRSGGHLRLQRLQWLMDINDWFSQHRHGADAIAYARASHNANPATPQR
jgi:hypothetical protein